ncbi:MAG: hypothetical protein JXB04_11260, partial [Kiritimatiellae bacterium]|nr:hypothetical protein [Kiritimatiellia bacterium]
MKRFAVAVLFAVLAAAPAFAAEIVVEIDETTTFQTMEGFGAAITESSAWLLYNVLTPAERTNLLNDLFSPEDGIGLSYVRHPMGASDFRLADYTYDDVPPGQTDFALANFSIAHDELCILPVLQHAASVNTNLKIIASPWSPPAWMKDSEDLYYGRLRNDAHDAFAKYFVRFVQSYASNGLPIEAVTLQNEPLFEPYSYAGMYMEATNQARLATRVGQDFASNGITTRILAYDHNWDQYQYPITVMNDAAANPYVAGSAFHGYAGDVAAQSLVHDAHPDKDIYITEITAGEWAAGFDDTLLWDAATLIVGGARHWARAVIKWNLALDQNNGPKTSGGCDTCYGIVTINTNTHAVTRNADYYSLAHASKFVRRGAVRVAATETPAVGPYSVAFVNPDASTVVIAANFHTTERHFVLRWKEQSAGYMLPPRSVATFTWPDVPGATADVWITTGDQTKLLEKQSAGPVFAPLSIEWKGRTWAVHDTLGDPGGNLWSAGCAWVDTNDCLRLEVKSVASNWYAGQVESTDPLSHGTYRWYVKGRPDLFDSNIVARLSTYFDAYHELDIDYTQAHDDAPTNLYYTVQPYYLNGHQQMFQHSLTSDYSTHEFAWNPRRVEYRSWYGHTSSPPAGALISEWSYEG